MKKIVNNVNSKISEIILELIPDSFKNRFRYYIPNPEKNFRDVTLGFRVWLRAVINLFIKCIVQFFTVLIGYSFLLFFLNYLWFIYVNTKVGSVFLSSQSAGVAVFIFQTVQQGVLPLVVDICMNVLIVVIPFSALISFLAIKRYFFDARGIVVQLVFALVISLFAVYLMESNKNCTQMKSLVFLYYIPTFCLMSTCFDLVSKFVPEFTIYSNIRVKIRDIINVAKIRNLD